MATGSLQWLPVEGLAYTAGTQSARTTPGGEFDYQGGETITFSVGDAELLAAEGAADLSPFDLAGVADSQNRKAVNYIRLMLGLDEDGVWSNGVQLAEAAHTQAAGMSIDLASDSFDTDVANLVANSGSVSGVLPSALEALAFVAGEMGATTGCGAGSRDGQVATLQTVAHGVSGVVTVVNSCTLLFSHFNYDGGGLPDVYFYTGPGGNFSSGQPVGDNLFGMPYSDASFTVATDAAELAGMDGLSVWCVQASVNFGSGLFTSVY